MNKPISTGILGTLVIIGIMLSTMKTGDIDVFLDLPSFLFVFGISATATLITARETKQRIKMFSRFSVLTGWLGFIIGLVSIIGDLDFVRNLQAIFPALSIALLPIFYGYTMKFFCGIWLRIIRANKH
tara:strand:+ start:726 stop:1109 length:384 start_codon:yes stop_codon:yes gene_type:complete